MISDSSLIIACPQCESCFELDADSVGPLGKKVRCSDCGYVWVQSLPTQPQKKEIAETPPLAPRDKALRVLRQQAEEEVELEAAPAFLTGPTESFEDEFLYKERVSSPASLTSRVFLILILGSIFFTLFFLGRHEIVRCFPSSRIIYQKMGFPVILCEDFVLSHTRWSHTKQGDLPAICVEGEMTNRSADTAYPPYLQISMRGQGECKPLTLIERFFGTDRADTSGGCLLSRWNIRVLEGQLLPNQTIPFKAIYPYSPGQRVTAVLLKLVERP